MERSVEVQALASKAIDLRSVVLDLLGPVGPIGILMTPRHWPHLSLSNH